MIHALAQSRAVLIACVAVMAMAACHQPPPQKPAPPPPTNPTSVSASESAAIDRTANITRDDTSFADLPPADDSVPTGEGGGSSPDGSQAQEIAGERVEQAGLPRSHDHEWSILRTTRIGIDKNGYYTATHSPQVRALAGSQMTISGFMVPLEATDTTRHFLISPYTPVCFFCPPGEPNEVIEVHTRRPVRSGYSLLRVSGRFGLANNADKGLFFTLDDGTADVLRQVAAN